MAVESPNHISSHCVTVSNHRPVDRLFAGVTCMKPCSPMWPSAMSLQHDLINEAHRDSAAADPSTASELLPKRGSLKSARMRLILFCQSPTSNSIKLSPAGLAILSISCRSASIFQAKLQTTKQPRRGAPLGNLSYEGHHHGHLQQETTRQPRCEQRPSCEWPSPSSPFQPRVCRAIHHGHAAGLWPMAEAHLA